MSKRACLVPLVALIATTCFGQAPVKKTDTDSAGVTAALQSYLAAFNKNDAKGVAALWAPQGVYVDQQTGERTTGRDALLADFQKSFKEHPGTRLAAEVSETRLVKPDVALVSGRATLLVPGEAPEVSAFSAVMVKQANNWLLESVHESPLPAPPSAQQALKELEWLVGHWIDDSKEVNVDTTVRWGTSNTFLVRSFVVTAKDAETQQGTQVIGWDPREKQIRSWSFFSDGSFAEGIWSKSGDQWFVKSTHTLDDGRIASGTQVIKRIDDNTLSVATIARDIDGEPAPASEAVRVMRAPEAKATTSTSK